MKWFYTWMSVIDLLQPLSVELLCSLLLVQSSCANCTVTPQWLLYAAAVRIQLADWTIVSRPPPIPLVSSARSSDRAPCHVLAIMQLWSEQKSALLLLIFVTFYFWKRWKKNNESSSVHIIRFTDKNGASKKLAQVEHTWGCCSSYSIVSVLVAGSTRSWKCCSCRGSTAGRRY